MKKHILLPIRFLLTLLTLTLLTHTAPAQAPEGISYQAIARDGNGNALSNQSVALEMTIHSGSATGPVVYQETHSTSTNQFGLFTLRIGAGTVQSGNFPMISWGDDSFFLEVRMDETGGSNYQAMGTSQLVSVPYALFAKTAETATNVDDADADPMNELQTISKSGNTVTLSNGGGSFTDAVDDADNNPSNEIQTLSVSGNTVTLSNGGGSVSVGDDHWTASGSDIYNSNSGDVGIGVTNPTRKLSVSSGDINVMGSSGSERTIVATTSDYGWLWTKGPANNTNTLITRISGNDNAGFLGAYDDGGNQRSTITVDPSSDVGLAFTQGPNGNINARWTWLNGNVNNGYFFVGDVNGNQQAGAYVNASGQGVVFGDIKNFRMDHPTQSGKEIWYASLEGPEAGAYDRGTATLVNGEATVTFSDHFELVANATTMTVLLTPLSADSEGMAVIEKTATGFKVKELHGGTGNYAFDWEVKAVRKGYENYRVVRDASESAPGGESVIEAEIPESAGE